VHVGAPRESAAALIPPPSPVATPLVSGRVLRATTSRRCSRVCFLLLSHPSSRRRTGVPRELLKSFMRQLLLAIDACHVHRIVHR
jgi:serine/threonine protein kinase